MLGWLDGGGTTVVTATRRLARAVREAHARAEIARGREAWPTPDVLPLDGHPTYLWALVALVATLHVAAFCYWVLA